MKFYKSLLSLLMLPAMLTSCSYVSDAEKTGYESYVNLVQLVNYNCTTYNMDTALTKGEIHINTKSFSETDNTKLIGSGIIIKEDSLSKTFYSIPFDKTIVSLNNTVDYTYAVVAVDELDVLLVIKTQSYIYFYDLYGNTVAVINSPENYSSCEVSAQTLFDDGKLFVYCKVDDTYALTYYNSISSLNRISTIDANTSYQNLINKFQHPNSKDGRYGSYYGLNDDYYVMTHGTYLHVVDKDWNYINDVNVNYNGYEPIGAIGGKLYYSRTIKATYDSQDYSYSDEEGQKYYYYVKSVDLLTGEEKDYKPNFVLHFLGYPLKSNETDYGYSQAIVYEIDEHKVLNTLDSETYTLDSNLNTVGKFDASFYAFKKLENGYYYNQYNYMLHNKNMNMVFDPEEYDVYYLPGINACVVKNSDREEAIADINGKILVDFSPRKYLTETARNNKILFIKDGWEYYSLDLNNPKNPNFVIKADNLVDKLDTGIYYTQSDDTLRFFNADGLNHSHRVDTDIIRLKSDYSYVSDNLAYSIIVLYDDNEKPISYISFSFYDLSKNFEVDEDLYFYM